MSFIHKSSPALNQQSWSSKAGFTLIEIIMTLVLVGIIAGLVGPFLGQVLGNFVDARQLSERERQATLALERFVRDVRAYDVTSIDQTTLNLNNGTIIYKLQSGSLALKRNRGWKILARYIDDEESSFASKPINGKYNLIILDLMVKVNNGNSLEYSAAAVRRGG